MNIDNITSKDMTLTNDGKAMQIKVYEEEISKLQKKIDQYENPDDLTLFYMWLDEKAKDKMKHLENQVLRLKQENQIISDLSLKNMEEINDKLDETVKKRNQLQSNWNSLRELIETDNKRAKGYIERIRTSDLCHGDYPVEYFYAEKRKEITDYYLDKMNELEGKDKECF